MILVDTSVWIDLLRGTGPLQGMLGRNEIFTQPFVIGELACGNLPDRANTLQLLQALPAVQMAQETEVMFFIEKHRLMRCGIGYVGMHFLAATALSACRIFTRDKRLQVLADKLNLAIATRIEAQRINRNAARPQDRPVAGPPSAEPP